MPRQGGGVHLEAVQEVTPRLLNRRKVGLAEGAVDITRPGPWGNPFIAGRDGSRAAVITLYSQWVYAQPQFIARIKRELKGKDLLCWCHPKRCHGEVLLKIANE